MTIHPAAVETVPRVLLCQQRLELRTTTRRSGALKTNKCFLLAQEMPYSLEAFRHAYLLWASRGIASCEVRSSTYLLAAKGSQPAVSSPAVRTKVSSRESNLHL